MNSPSSRIELEGNTLKGSAFVSNSVASLSTNTISGSLMCTNGGKLVHYDADDSNMNSVRGKNTC